MDGVNDRKDPGDCAVLVADNQLGLYGALLKKSFKKNRIRNLPSTLKDVILH